MIVCQNVHTVVHFQGILAKLSGNVWNIDGCLDTNHLGKHHSTENYEDCDYDPLTEWSFMDVSS